MKSSVAVDLGWFRNLDMHQFNANLNAVFALGVSQSARENILRQALQGDKSLNSLLECVRFFESLVVSPDPVIDARALEMDKEEVYMRYPTLSGLIRPHIPSVSVYEKAYEKTSMILQQLRKQGKSSLELEGLWGEMLDPGSGNIFWDHTQKNVHDWLCKNNMRSFAESVSDVPARTIFYIAFSESLGTPPLLSESKSKWLSRLGQAFDDAMHNKITQVVSNVMADKKILFSSNLLVKEDNAPMPPVSQWILRHAYDEKTTISDAAKAISTRPETIAYRRFLTELLKLQALGDAGMLEYNEKLAEVKSMAEEWHKHNNSKVGIKYKIREMKLKQIPQIGPYLDALGLESIKFKDYLLNAPPGHLTFISSWYSSH